MTDKFRSDKGGRKQRKSRAEMLAEMLADQLNCLDTRGLHGGGETVVRATMRTRPRKGNTWRGRQAHPSLLRQYADPKVATKWWQED